MIIRFEDLIRETEAAVIKKVLIINDSGFERMVLRDQIRMLGYEVKTADEITGLSMIKGFHPDIVVANLTMTDISGDKLLEHIKSTAPHIRCFLSSCSKINWEMVDNDIIDGVIETPVANTTLGKILNESGLGPNKAEGSAYLPEEKDFINEQTNLQGSVPALKICSSCGKDLNKTGNEFSFCPFCGTRL